MNPDWISSHNGNLIITEFLSIGYDTKTNMIMGGAQDNSFLISTIDHIKGRNMNYVGLCAGDGQSLALDMTTNPTILYARSVMNMKMSTHVYHMYTDQTKLSCQHVCSWHVS